VQESKSRKAPQPVQLQSTTGAIVLGGTCGAELDPAGSWGLAGSWGGSWGEAVVLAVQAVS